MNRRFLITLVTFVIIAMAAFAAVLLAKGYTFSPQQKRLVGTGIISITSTPDAASVFLDGHLTTATNANISSLPPKEYMVRIVKEGFIPWERKVEVKEGLVSDLKVRLFPAIPTIYPLTFTGVLNATLSPDGQKLVYIVPTGKKAGVWVWQMSFDQPIAFARGAEPHQISSSGITDYSKAILRFSPDSKQVLASKGANNYLLETSQLNTEPKDITPLLSSTLKGWDDDQKSADAARILNIKDLEIRKIASESAELKWSPDETKFLFASELVDQKFKVYDVEEKVEYQIPEAKAHFWLPDSRHIVLVEESNISVVDFDGTNKAVVYAGKFEPTQVFTWPDSSRLALVTSFPTPTASEPNLYGINLK